MEELFILFIILVVIGACYYEFKRLKRQERQAAAIRQEIRDSQERERLRFKAREMKTLEPLPPLTSKELAAVRLKQAKR